MDREGLELGWWSRASLLSRELLDCWLCCPVRWPPLWGARMHYTCTYECHADDEVLLVVVVEAVVVVVVAVDVAVVDVVAA